MTLVKNGAQIQIGAELKIRAKNIPSDKTLEEWKINGKTVAPATETFSHTIVKEDSDSNGKTYITYTLKNKPVLLKINFDTEQIKVESKQAGTWQPLSSGSEIVDNTQLRLTAIGLPADSTVQSWIVGKTNIPAEGHELTYIVRKTDANDNNIVTISYTERKSVNLKINFDAAQVKVEAEQAGTWNALTSGSTVQEHTRLRLTAIGLPAGTPVQAWKVGNTIVPAEGAELIHTVRKVDADSSNRVALAYTVKSDNCL